MWIQRLLMSSNGKNGPQSELPRRLLWRFITTRSAIMKLSPVSEISASVYLSVS